MKYACITMDVESDLNSREYDIELFRDRDKLNLFKEIIDKHDVKLTGYLVTNILEHNPLLIDNAKSLLPIKFEVHSHSHNQSEPDSEREIDKALECYTKFFSQAPKGYRAPNGLISPEGLIRLAEKGFVYDASIFPSYRFDEYGYNNADLPIQPYIYKTPSNDIIELPFAVIPKVRLVVSISFIKLLSWYFYKGLINIFGLPDILIIDTHPYDFFIKNHLHRVKGWKKIAHARNADNAMLLFDYLLVELNKLGYKFVYVNDVIESINKANMVRVNIKQRH